jgi:hypothetical protein
MITVNHRKVDPTSVLQNNDLILNSIHRHEPPVTGHPIEIVHEDNEVLVVNKCVLAHTLSLLRIPPSLSPTHAHPLYYKPLEPLAHANRTHTHATVPAPHRPGSIRALTMSSVTTLMTSHNTAGPVRSLYILPVGTLAAAPPPPPPPPPCCIQHTDADHHASR